MCFGELPVECPGPLCDYIRGAECQLALHPVGFGMYAQITQHRPQPGAVLECLNRLYPSKLFMYFRRAAVACTAQYHGRLKAVWQPYSCGRSIFLFPEVCG